MEIIFDEKFTSKHLHQIISDYWKESFIEREVIFNLHNLEWISLEEINFLFGWIRKVKQYNSELKKIEVRLPNPDKVKPENDDKARRRKTRAISLWKTWGIHSNCNLSKGDFDTNSININAAIDDDSEKDETWHQIYPFKVLPIKQKIDSNTIRNDLKYELIKSLKLTDEIRKLLDQHRSSSLFENKILAEIIGVELYLNSILHTQGENSTECYVSSTFLNKVNIEAYSIKKSISLEEAKDAVQNILKRGVEAERMEIERPFFKRSDTNYRNDSFIEFSFIDFGSGISSKLQNQYLKEIKEKPEIKGMLSHYHLDADTVNIDSLVIEYAFLLHSSSYPFDEQIEINGFIPRGLYLLVNIIKRYSGLLVINSGNGSVAFDFKDNSKEIKNCVRMAKNSEVTYFPGTSISIYISENKSEIFHGPVESSLELKTTERNTERNIEYYSVENMVRKFASSPLEGKLYVQIFNQINEMFSMARGKTVFLLDFTGSSLSFIDHKLYYFLTQHPLVSKDLNLVILHPVNKAIVLDVQQTIIDNHDWNSRTIPAIFSQKDIIWLGIHDLADEKLLNKIWNYPDHHESLSDFQSALSATGNLVEIKWVNRKTNIANVEFTFYPKLLYLTEAVSAKYIMDLLLDETINPSILRKYPNKLDKKRKEIHWTAGGYYQFEFIRFIEQLYQVSFENSSGDNKDFVFAENCAQYLLDKYESKIDGNIGFNTIVCITLSAQLLANEVKEKLSDSNPKLKIIRLSSYHDFTSDESFKTLGNSNKVLLVNDVINTGGLTKRVSEALQNKGAELNAIFTLVDSRDPDPKSEVPHIFEQELDKKTFSLLKYPIKKYKNNPTPDYKVITIDPIVNTPNTMRLERSDLSRLVYSSQKELSNFLRKFRTEDLLVGHFHHNKSHHTYFFNLHNWFKSDTGKNDLTEIVKKVITHSSSTAKTIQKNHEKDGLVADLKSKLEKQEAVFIQEAPKEYNNALKALEKLRSKSNSIPFELPKPNIVFYPLYGALEILNKNDWKNILGHKNHNDFLLFPLGRIDTPEGWRFTFPPKTLNKVSHQFSNALIVDDGSCSGDTILQMIDSVAFLGVERIRVISIVARLEDFQREFFNRLQSINIRYEKTETVSNEVQDRVVDLELFFGVHFHIRTYSPLRNCPICKEEAELTKFLNRNTGIPGKLKTFIIEQKEALEALDSGFFDGHEEQILDHQNKFIPDNTDKHKLFEYRNVVGKLVTFRHYQDYMNIPDDDLELWMIIISVEPRLYEVLKKYSPELVEKLKKNAKKIVIKEKKLKYNWNPSKLIKTLWIIIPIEMEKTDHLIKLLEDPLMVKKETKAYKVELTNAVLFFLTKGILDGKTSLINEVSKLYLRISKIHDSDSAELDQRYKVLEELNSWLHQEDFWNPEHNNVFTKLRKFFFSETSTFFSHSRFIQQYIDPILDQIGIIKTPYERGEISGLGVQPNNPDLEDLFNRVNGLEDNLETKLLSQIDESQFNKVIKHTPFYDKYCQGQSHYPRELIERINRIIADTKSLLRFDELIELENLVRQLKDAYLVNNSEFAQFFIHLGTIEQSEFDTFLVEKCSTLTQNGIAIAKPTIPNNFAPFIHYELLKFIINELCRNCLKHTNRHRNEGNTDNVSAKFFFYSLPQPYIIYEHSLPGAPDALKNGLAEVQEVVEYFRGYVEMTNSTPTFGLKLNLVNQHYEN